MINSGIKKPKIKQAKFVFIPAAVLLVAVLVVLFAFPQQSRDYSAGRIISQHRDGLLGTIITISIPETADAADIFDEVFSAIEGIDARMSATRPDSQVARINAMAGVEPVKVPDDVFHVVSLAAQISGDSGGAFDLSVGPLVSLWGIGSFNARVPSDAEILETQGLVGYGNVLLNPAEASVYLKKEGMSIDLGAIAKGYAGEVAAEILVRRGIRSAILDLGGDIVAVGSRPDGNAWRIGVRAPVRGGGGGIVTAFQDFERAIMQWGGDAWPRETSGIFDYIAVNRWNKPYKLEALKAAIDTMVKYATRPQPVEVTPQPDYRLLIAFDNGEKRMLDVKPYLEIEPYKELKNPVVFNNVKVAGLIVEWRPRVDMGIDVIYGESVPV